MKNKAVSAPITFEEIVMIVVNYSKTSNHVVFAVDSGLQLFKPQMELDTLFM